MGQLHWRLLATVTVPENIGVRWSLAREFVPAGKLLRIQVKPVAPAPPQAQGQPGISQGAPAMWQPEGMNSPCDADGDVSQAMSQSATLPMTRARRGALIGRIGGGSADETPDDKSMLLFAVGRLCVLQVPDDKRGSLFLGVNDHAENAVRIQGSFEVEIFEAL
jgi:hypothetical protein